MRHLATTAVLVALSACSSSLRTDLLSREELLRERRNARTQSAVGVVLASIGFGLLVGGIVYGRSGRETCNFVYNSDPCDSFETAMNRGIIAAMGIMSGTGATLTGLLVTAGAHSTLERIDAAIRSDPRAQDPARFVHPIAPPEELDPMP
jgi:hypothetical protein